MKPLLAKYLICFAEVYACFMFCVLHAYHIFTFTHRSNMLFIYVQNLSRILCVTFYLCRCLSCHNAEKKWDKSNEDAVRHFALTLSLRFCCGKRCLCTILILVFFSHFVSVRFGLSLRGFFRRLIASKKLKYAPYEHLYNHLCIISHEHILSA